jgi:hypothetical protein
MQRIEMTWLLLQDFPIDALRVRKVPLPVQRHSLPKLGLQCYRIRMLCLRLGNANFRHCYILNGIVWPMLVIGTAPPS